MIFILAILLGLFLAFVCAPIVIAANRSKIKAMRGIVEQYENALKEGGMPDPVFTKRETRKRLLAIKRKIFPGDKKAVIEAGDILADFDTIA